MKPCRSPFLSRLVPGLVFLSLGLGDPGPAWPQTAAASEAPSALEDRGGRAGPALYPGDVAYGGWVPEARFDGRNGAWTLRFEAQAPPWTALRPSLGLGFDTAGPAWTAEAALGWVLEAPPRWRWIPELGWGGRGDGPDLSAWNPRALAGLRLETDVAPRLGLRTGLLLTWPLGAEAPAWSGLLGFRYGMDWPWPVAETELSLEVGPQPFSPDGDGTADLLHLRGEFRPPEALATWSLEVRELGGQLLRSWAGSEPRLSLDWDGRDAEGRLVASATEYEVIVRTRDRFGRLRRFAVPLLTDILVERDGNRARIRLPSIEFDPGEAQLRPEGQGQNASLPNAAILERLAEILRRFPRARILIEGHGNLTRWAAPAEAAREELEEVGPLSLARAQAVRDYLITLGIPAAQLSVRGAGGSRPVVPFSDADQRWKNRRVEFFMETR